MSCGNTSERHFLLNRFVPIGTVQQDQAGGTHVQADLRITALVTPGARAQLLTRHLQERTLVDVLLDRSHQAIPAAHAHPQRLFARTGLAVAAAEKLATCCSPTVLTSG